MKNGYVLSLVSSKGSGHVFFFSFCWGCGYVSFSGAFSLTLLVKPSIIHLVT